MATEVEVTQRTVASVNPASGEALAEFPCASTSEVESAVARARHAQPEWARAGFHHRVQVLRRFQRLLAEKKTEIAAAITREAGKPYVEALLTEVVVALDTAGFCAREAPALLHAEPVPHANPIMKAKVGHLHREPYGVIGIISPWNYPFATPASETLAALATGNAVVLKPSEFTPQVALELQSLLHQAGVPLDVFQVVLGDGATGAAVIGSGIDKLVFTGSVATGRKIAQAAAAHLLPVVLELGGKDPMLVLDDADIGIASSAAVWGAFVNAGQACLSVERCYVHRKLYHDFVAACAEKAKRLRVGDGMNRDTDVGPLIHQRQLRIVEEHVSDAVAQGARLLVGGTRLPQLGPNFYAPTVLADVTHSMRIMREETFGPVLPIMSFHTDEEAVRLANDSDFGLAASIWTSHTARGKELALHLLAGTVMINDVVTCFGISEAPHGGVKASGIGHTHGRMGLEEMVRVKYVDSDRFPRMRKVWWYGYGHAFARQMEAFVDSLFAHRVHSRLRGALRSAGALRRGRKI